jgi:hypothetical protein
MRDSPYRRGMDRRRFLFISAAGTLAGSFATEAQQAGKTARVGWVAGHPGALPTVSFLEAFRSGMRDRGWVDGKNLIIEARWGDRDLTQSSGKLHDGQALRWERKRELGHDAGHGSETRTHFLSLLIRNDFAAIEAVGDATGRLSC